LIYIDAFAGSGIASLRTDEVIEGSASLAMNYDFDEYYFIEYDFDRLTELKKYIDDKYPNKVKKIKYIQGDCNIELPKIFDFLGPYKRGIMLLDPYAMELKWDILKEAQRTKILDIWYLFPFMAVNRCLKSDGEIPEKLKLTLDYILPKGWYEALYFKNPQYNMFDTVEYKRVDFEKLIDFIYDELNKIFPYVGPSKKLKNSKNTLLFILYFAVSNPSPKAVALAKKVVTDITNSI
jgi:hypothetical protein